MTNNDLEKSWANNSKPVTAPVQAKPMATRNANTIAELDDLEESLALDLEKRLNDADAKGESKATAQSGKDDKPSGRIQEIQRRRISNKELEDRIRESMALLSAAATDAGIVTEYLDGVELELKSLEHSETSLESLRENNETILRDNRELRTDLKDHRKRLLLLESKIKSLREYNDKSRTLISRLLGKKQSASLAYSEIKADVLRLEKELADTVARLKRSTSERDDALEAAKDAREKQRELQADLDIAKRALFERDKRVNELSETVMTLSTERNDLNARNSALEETRTEQNSRIDDLEYQLSSSLKKFEEIVRLKQQRILELEGRSDEAPKTDLVKDSSGKDEQKSEPVKADVKRQTLEVVDTPSMDTGIDELAAFQKKMEAASEPVKREPVKDVSTGSTKH